MNDTVFMTVEDWLGKDNQLGIDIWNKKYRYDNETFGEWLERVSGHNERVKQMIVEKKFLFGGRILAMRGIDDDTHASYSNCYVIPPPEDNLESIYDTCKRLARTYSWGGGCGIDISKLAPAGAIVHNQARTSSGAVSFMDTFSQVTQQIGQHGRRGALMISIDCRHPDLEQFIRVKMNTDKVNYANISVRVSDDFMNAVLDNLDWELRFERAETCEVISKTVKAKDIFHLLCEANWNYAEPGILFWDRIESYNMMSEVPDFHYAGTNPCAEEPLPAYGACNLGSINLSAFVDGGEFDFDSFEECVAIAVAALNEVQKEGTKKHPLPEQRECADQLRQIGLGIFGLADMLIKLGIRYGSSRAVELCDKIGNAMAVAALDESSEEAAFFGRFPKYDDRILISPFVKHHVASNPMLLRKLQTYGLANSQILTIAPTGTLSTMIGVSGGIEPIFANYYTRTTKTLHGGEDVTYKVYTPIVKEYMESHNLTDDSELPDYFITSAQIPIAERIAMQSVWQTHIDASISSTINLPHEATVEDVERLYMSAWKFGLKGVTVYRAGCAREGILNAESKSEENPKEEKQTKALVVQKKNIGLERHLTTGCGSLHICAFFNENGELKNTYLSKGSAGGCNNFMIGLSRMISLAARSGVSIQNIVDQLNSCGTCPSYAVRRATKHDTSIGSCCPVAIGNALMDMYREVNGNEEYVKSFCGNKEKTTAVKEPPASTPAKCPECGGTLIHEMGCVTCTTCGYSKCG